MNPITRRLHVVACGAVAATLVFAACGDDDDDSAGTDPPATVDATAAAATTPTTAAGASTTHDMSAMETISVNAIDYAFEDLPASIPVGSMITLTNSSEVELHELVAVPLAADEERTIEELIALPGEELGALIDSTEPALVMIAPPGEEGFAVVGDGTLTEAGRYLVICNIPLGADPAEYLAAAQEATDGPPQVEGGPPHFTQGMYAELVVE